MNQSLLTFISNYEVENITNLCFPVLEVAEKCRQYLLLNIQCYPSINMQKPSYAVAIGEVESSTIERFLNLQYYCTNLDEIE